MYPEPEWKPTAPGQIVFHGEILNGRRNIRHELDIQDRNQLHSNIQRRIQAPLDPVIASHLHWGELRRNRHFTDGS